MTFMRKIYLGIGILILVALGGYLMFGRGGLDDAKDAYIGQWLLSGAGKDIMNFRADGNFLEVNWGTIGDPSTITAAIKGTYSFKPDREGDQTHGNILLVITYDYDTEQKKWIARANPGYSTQTCAITPRSKILLNGSPFSRYGGESAIPEKF